MALSNEAIQGLLAFGMGTLANNTGNYGMFGPAVGKGGLLGLQAYGNAQENTLRKGMFEDEKAYRKFQMDDAAAVRKMEQDKLNLEQENQRLISEELARLGGGYASQPTAAQVRPMAPQGTPLAPFTQDSIRAALAMGAGPTREAENMLLQGGVREQSINAPAVAPDGQNWPDPQAYVQSALRMAQLDPRIAQTLMSGANFYQGAIKEDTAAKEREATAQRGKLTPVTGLPGVFVDNDNEKYYKWERTPEGLKQTELTTDELIAMDLASGSARAPKMTQNAGGESVLKEIGPILTESRTAAMGAIEQVDAAQRIKKALDDGGVIAGPTATIRMKGAQIASMLGIGGRNTAEAIANTRQAIRGLAEFTISVRSKLKGQGQVTEYEQKTLQKAYSGEIDDMTVDELKVVAGLTERMARLLHKNHKEQLENMQNSEDPKMRGAVPFYRVPDLPPETPAKVRRYNPATGKIE